ncbi:DMT family transporter [candidate division WWE3 bacterium]|nr:DMT family transporter [candidate division WWE3 bacterium]
MLIRTAELKKKKLVIAFLILTTIIWGAAGPIIKYTLEYVPPFTFLFLRFLTSTAVILPFMIFEERQNPVSKKDILNLVILSFLGGTLTLGFTFYGFKYTSSLDASLIGALSPIFILIASSRLLGEKITKNEKIGSAVAIIGTLVVALQPLLEKGSASTNSQALSQILGNLFIVVSLLTWTAYTIWSKKILDHIPSKLGFIFHYLHLRSTMKQYSPIFMTAVLCVVSLITFAPLSLYEIYQIKNQQEPIPFSNQSLNPLANTYAFPNLPAEMIKPLLGILYMGVFSTLVAYGLYEWAIKEIPVAETAIFAYLQPIFTIPFAYVIVGERITFWYLIGGLIVLAGIYLSERKDVTSL